MSINTQILDHRVSNLAASLRPRLIEEAKIRDEGTRIKSATFVFLVMQTLLDLSDDDAIDCLVDGSGDYGIDGIHLTSPQDGEFNVMLFQGKYKDRLDGENHFEQRAIEKGLLALETLFDPKKPINSASERLKDRVEEIRSLVAEGYLPKVKFVACSNGLKWNEATQEIIDNKKFGDIVSWSHVGPDEIINLMQATAPVDDSITLKGKALVEDYNFKRVLVGRMPVSNLKTLFDKYGDRLLERNIRRYLGLSGSRINENIAKTLRDREQSPNFYFYNNGITIICSQFRHNALASDDWTVHIKGLQIINGGQTSKTVQQILTEMPEAADAQVLVRIYEVPADDTDLIRNITYATNSQNPVDLRDLRSTDERQRVLGMAIEELGYTYRGQRSETSSSKSTDLTSAVVAEAVLAVWRQRPHQARFMSSEHFGKLYDLIFTPDLNGAQAVLAALILRFAENKRKRPPEGAPEFLPYGSRFVAMLMGHYLLADLGINRANLSELNHRRFRDAAQTFEQNAERYFQTALSAISDALPSLLTGEPPYTLQRLSAAFRRADLIEILQGAPLQIPLH